MRDFLKKNWQILILEFIVLAAFCVFYGKFGDMFVDSFREAYIPWQMNEGEILYKDIFCIYPPLAYIINSILFKLLGTNLSILYCTGLLCSMGILYLTYKISEKFLAKYTSFGICLFLISGLILSPNVFNGFFPYSYGMIYGLLFILGSIYCLLNKKYPLAYLLYSLAICSKYEFILLLPLMIFVTKNVNWKKNILTLFLPLVTTVGIVLVQGTSLQDLKTACELIILMGQTKTLHFFYSSMGLIFHPEHIVLYVVNFFKFILPVNWNLYQEIIMWAFPVISILFIIKYKSLSFERKIFIISSVLISLKVFFAMTMQSYGVYFIPFALISLAILTPDKFKKYLTLLLIIWGLIIGYFNINILAKKDYNELHEVSEYISQKTAKNDTVAVYPEGLGINFISKRKSDSKFYSLIPLYTEVFGEDIIIKRLEHIKPQYIIINDFDTSAYYYKKFGDDYCINVMNWIKQNYTLEKSFKIPYEFDIYRLNL